MVLRAGGLTGLMNQPTAQVIDGSLKFDQSESQYLTRTFGAGNRRTWTHSSWVKQGDFGRKKSFFMVGPSSGLSNSNYLSLDFDDNDKLRYAGGGENYKVTSQVLEILVGIMWFGHVTPHKQQQLIEQKFM